MKNLADQLTGASVPSSKPATTTTAAPKQLELGLLTALVVGSMIGSGVFSLPQNMASGAGAGAVLIGWLITGVGMLMLAFVYQTLTIRKPDLDNGIYAYARATAGEFVGFNSVWGYWVSAWLGNVGYLVIVFGTLGYFFPIFGDGNTRAAVLGASIVLWVMHFVILRGVRGAAVLNAITTVAKIIPLLAFILLALLAFRNHVFTQDFWGDPKHGYRVHPGEEHHADHRVGLHRYRRCECVFGARTTSRGCRPRHGIRFCARAAVADGRIAAVARHRLAERARSDEEPLNGRCAGQSGRHLGRSVDQRRAAGFGRRRPARLDAARG